MRGRREKNVKPKRTIQSFHLSERCRSKMEYAGSKNIFLF